MNKRIVCSVALMCLTTACVNALSFFEVKKVLSQSIGQYKNSEGQLVYMPNDCITMIAQEYCKQQRSDTNRRRNARRAARRKLIEEARKRSYQNPCNTLRNS